MGKYIVELKKNETLYKAATRESDGTAYVCSAIGTPYTEPDLDVIRNEAYEKGVQDTKQHWVDAPRTCAYQLGYENGLNDAWEAAKKIGSNSMYSLKEMGFDFSQCVVSDYNPSWFVVKNYSAAEAIEKIRQYEQEKKQKGKIKAGDVVQHKSKPDIKIWVIYVNECDDQMITGVATESVFGCCKVGEACINRDAKDWKKTGEHYDVAEFLQKMKEES